MARSTCVRCDGTSFELQENSPRTSNYVLLFVQCTSCGGVVGVIEANNVGVMLSKQNKALKRIARAVNLHISDSELQG